MRIECLGSSSLGNSYIIEFDDGKVLLLEAGVPWKTISKALGMRRNDLIGCLITHEHQDHAKSVKDLLANGIKCYMSEGTSDALGITKNLYTKTILQSLPFMIDHNRKITGYQGNHNAAQPLIWTIIDKLSKESMVFFTDSAFTKQRFDKFNYYLVEDNYLKELAEHSDHKHGTVGHLGHESLKKMLSLTDLSRANFIILLHLSASNSNEEFMVNDIRKMTGVEVDVADKGKVWKLPFTPF